MGHNIDSVITLHASETKTLTTTSGLAALFFTLSQSENGISIRFPLTIMCPHCTTIYTIRSLDDFPYKSKKCSCDQFYLVKLVKVTQDGTPEKIL